MNNIKQLPDFKDDHEIIEFMESHDGFELADQGFAEIVETPVFSKKDTKQIILNPETLQLIDELVRAGICTDVRDVINKAVQSYVLAVMPDSYKIIREK
jgi:hypothetical protein